MVKPAVNKVEGIIVPKEYIMELTNTFDEKDFHFVKNVTIGDLSNNSFMTSIVNFISKLDAKAKTGRIVVMDENKPENTEIYTYQKFLQVYDKMGFDGFRK